MVHTFALRKDLILAFEIVLRQIQNKKQDIQFLISEDMEEELKNIYHLHLRLIMSFLIQRVKKKLVAVNQSYLWIV